MTTDAEYRAQPMVNAEMKALEAENARLRDVVEAAKAWDTADLAALCGSRSEIMRMKEAARDLRAAVRAYEAQKEGETHGNV